MDNGLLIALGIGAAFFILRKPERAAPGANAEGLGGYTGLAAELDAAIARYSRTGASPAEVSAPSGSEPVGYSATVEIAAPTGGSFSAYDAAFAWMVNQAGVRDRTGTVNGYSYDLDSGEAWETPVYVTTTKERQDDATPAPPAPMAAVSFDEDIGVRPGSAVSAPGYDWIDAAIASSFLTQPSTEPVINESPVRVVSVSPTVGEPIAARSEYVGYMSFEEPATPTQGEPIRGTGSATLGFF